MWFGQADEVSVRADGTWPSALVRAYEQHGAAFTQVAFMVLGSRAEAEEVVHEAVMATLRNWPQVREPVPYLRRAVVNGARGVLRRREIAERFRPDVPPPSAPEQLVELRDLLLALPLRQREALVLRFVADLDDEETAAILGCRRATVRSLVARGLTTIRKELA